MSLNKNTLIQMVLCVTCLLCMFFLGKKLYFGRPSIILTCHFYIFIFMFLTLVLNTILVKVSIRSKINITLVIFSCCASLVTGEIYLRYIDKTYATYNEKNGDFYYVSPYEPFRKPNGLCKGKQKTAVILKKPEFAIEHRYNSDGLRDVEHSERKKVNEYRIVGIGDSFTEGVGTGQNSTWLKQLENKLQQTYPVHLIRTINAGVNGSDPFFGYTLLQEKMSKYKPDMVIVAINNSDINDMIVRGGMDRFQPDGTVKYSQGPSWEWLYSISFIFRHIIHDFCNYNWQFYKPDQMKSERNTAIELINDSISQFYRLSKGNKFDLIVVFHPQSYEVLSRTSDLSKLYQRLNSFSEIKVINLLEYYLYKGHLNKENISDFYWPVDFHHTKKGYGLWASGLFEYIVNKNCIQKQATLKQHIQRTKKHL